MTRQMILAIDGGQYNDPDNLTAPRDPARSGRVRFGAARPRRPSDPANPGIMMPPVLFGAQLLKAGLDQEGRRSGTGCGRLQAAAAAGIRTEPNRFDSGCPATRRRPSSHCRAVGMPLMGPSAAGSGRQKGVCDAGQPSVESSWILRGGRAADAVRTERNFANADGERGAWGGYRAGTVGCGRPPRTAGDSDWRLGHVFTWGPVLT